MSSNAQFTGEIPRNYDEGLGPVLFIQYAEDMAARARALEPTSVLELAAGTGLVTRPLRDALPASTSILATDLNEAMLEIARPRFNENENVKFQVVDAMSIPVEDNSLDMVLCQFGVMFFPDKVASYREALRILRPGGTYLFSAWGSWETNPWAGLAQRTVERFFKSDPPKFYEVPFHYFDEAEIRSDLETAGFADIRIEHLPKTGRIASHDKFSHATIFGNPIADQIRAQGTDVTPEQAQQAVHDILVETYGPSPTTMPMSALIITAKKL